MWVDMSGSLFRPPQTKILRTDSSDCMYVMNCVEVEITSPEEAFEVLFKGKQLLKMQAASRFICNKYTFR